ncbi:MAG: LptF/LptG family permease [Planctomycetes bacterium]|nr:LptF/LptG family permease [Planctomycetota bacterium]
MRTLHKYIAEELMRGFLISFLVLLVIIFVGFAIRLVHQGMDIVQVKFVFPHLAMQSFPYTIPLSLLIAVIMTYGRLSADNEITALRSSGIHLQMIVTPTMIIAVLFSIVSFFVIAKMVPYSERQIRSIMMDATTWTSMIEDLGKTQKRIRLQGWLIYVDKQDEDGTLHGISIYRVSQEFVAETYDAKRGRIDVVNENARIHLENGFFTKQNYERPDDVKTIHFNTFDVGIPINQNPETEDYHNPRFLSLFKQWRSLAKLRERIKGHNEIFSDPAAARKYWVKKRDTLDVKCNEVRHQVNDLKSKITHLDEREKKDRRMLEEFEISRKENAAAVYAQQKHWQRMKQETDAKAAELERKHDEQLGLLKKLKTAGANTDGAGGDSVVDEEDAKRLRILNAEIAGLKDMILRLQKNTASAKEAYESARQVLKDVDGRIADLKFSLDSAATLREEFSRQIEELQGEVAEYAKERKEANKNCCQAIEQQEAYELRIMINESIALSFSCLAFVLAAVPLGIYSRHGHVLVAMAIGFALALSYFGILMVGRLLAQDRYLPCWISLWSADIIIGALGIILLANVFRK